MIPDNVAVALPSPRAIAAVKDSLLARTLMGGTEAMRAAGEVFLPRHKAEKQSVYDARLAATTLFNVFADTVAKQVGKIFSEPVVLGDDVPPEIKTLCANIDGQGRALTPFAIDVLMKAMTVGVSYILVEYPQVNPQPGQKIVTLADQRTMKARPYWVLVTQDQLLGWRTEDVGGTQRLTQIRIHETVTAADGRFGEASVEQVRVLEPGRFEVWRQVESKGGEKIYAKVEEGTTSSTEIMLVPVYTNRTAFMEGRPPLQALAELNQEHWVSSSENRHALMFLRFAMIYFKGLSQEEINQIEIGPDKGFALPENGEAGYLEHSGKGIDAGFQDLDRIEKRMETAGMTVRVENAGSVTATTSAINSAEGNAALRAIAQGLKDSLEQALQYTAQLLGLQNGGTVDVCDDFAEEPPQGTVDELIKLRATNNISRATLWEILKERSVLPEDFDEEAEAVKLQNDVDTDMGAPPNGLQDKEQRQEAAA